jgi:hypothetical protein
VADYSKQTKNKRHVKISCGAPFHDIECFTLQNDINLSNGIIVFNGKSFIKPNKDMGSQCECVVFPKTSDIHSWILFIELKYCDKPSDNEKPYNNEYNLRKAIKQLYKTRTYYYSRGIFSKTNTCYLLVSLPKQAEPFAQAIISPMDLVQLKGRHNVILRLLNSAIIQDDRTIDVRDV